MDIGRKKDLLVFLLIIILALSVGYNGIYKRNLNKIASLNSEIEEEKKKSDILGMIGVLDRKSKAYQNRSFPTTEVTQLLDRVLELAKEADIEIETFNPLPVIRQEQYIELPIRIPLRCEYHRLGQFLSLIESNQELIWIKEIRMTKSTVTDRRMTKIPKIDLTVSGLYLKK